MIAWGAPFPEREDDHEKRRRRPRSPARTAGRILAALVVGGFAGVVAMVGLLAFRAAVEEVYIHGLADVLGWPVVPALAVPVCLVVVAWRLRNHQFWRWLGLVLAGLAAGALTGAGAGALFVSHASGPWAGALIGAGGVAFLVAALALAAALRSDGSLMGWAAASLLFLSLLAYGCTPDADPPPGAPRVGPPADSAEVESVVFLLGDPGVARVDTHPILRRMREDVEAWSRVLEGDGQVRVLILGDVIYPAGFHSADDERRRMDSLRVVDQISVVGGPRAEAAGARILFLPGNHDWGQEEDWDGAVRVHRMADFLEGWDGPGHGRAELAPPAGEGVEIVDLGDNLRMILLDTAWWLLGRDEGEKKAFTEAVRRALATADGRRTLVAAHHPLESGGPHGADVYMGSLLGVRFVLKRAGVMVQDLDSRPYASLKRTLMQAFSEEGRPDVFAGGHDHSLQVFGASAFGATRGLVVGSASKLTGVGGAVGMLFARSEPGYAKVLVHRDGTLRVEVDAAPREVLACPAESGAACVEEGVDAYRTVWRETVVRSAAATRLTSGDPESGSASSPKAEGSP